MAKKNEHKASRSYLKVIMGFAIAFSVLSLITGICIWFAKAFADDDILKMINVTSIADKDLAQMNMSRVDFARMTLGMAMFMYTIFYAIEAWLIARALKDSRKSTFLLICSVLGLISAITALFTGGFDNSSVVFSNVASVVLNGILFASIYKIRQEND